MSAWMLDSEQMNVILYFAGAGSGIPGNRHGGAWIELPSGWTHITDQNASEVGAILLDQNRKSVNYRYSEDEIEQVYVYRKPAARDRWGDVTWSLVDAAKALASYRYQSCETNDWEQTTAYRIATRIAEHYLSLMPGYEESDGWSIDSPTLEGTR
jgi:hypothetical protein